MNKTIAILTAATAILTTGCNRIGSLGTDYTTVDRSSARDTASARKHTLTAVKLIEEGKLDEAREELKSALAADLFHGPAHNNMGGVHLKQKRYYLAAWEFQYAAKLMPNQAEPRNNLGMVFETVGRLDEAQQWYDKALALEPEEVEIAANLARIHTRKSINNERTRELLAMVVMKDQRSEWVRWARGRLAMIGQPETSPLQFGKSQSEERRPETQPAKSIQ